MLFIPITLLFFTFIGSSMSESLVLIPEERVRQLLDWESVVDAVEAALKAVSQDRAVLTPRSFTKVKDGENLLLSMPGYVENANKSVLATKLVTVFPENEKRQPALPSIISNVFLFDTETGKMKAIIESNEITAWRTAAASVVATKHLHNQLPGKMNKILAILGAGTQGRIHAIALQHFFNFTEVRIWNRTPSRMAKLVMELKGLGIPAGGVNTVEDCVRDADVIVTATYATSPLVNLKMIKTNAHINAIGAGTTHHGELGEDIYRKALIYTDHEESARVELKGLYDLGARMEGEIGKVVSDRNNRPNGSTMTIFQSLGIAAEDALVGQLIYDRHVGAGK